MAKDFTFKQFHINAFQCGMPVSTDAVLLGAWANIAKSESILDIGCGTGILSLMCAQRNELARITAIEIEENAFNAALKNSQNSPWKKRVDVQHLSIQEFVKTKQNYDSIICNPPYFYNGEASKSEQRATARHTSALTHLDLLYYCVQLLTEIGSASFILPTVEGKLFINLLIEMEMPLYVSRLTYVKTTITKASTRMLIELNRASQYALINAVEDELVIHNGEVYSEEFIALTKNFYLKM
ncbi:methyltransferase [Psychromonas sp.]|nr:methyltransferase [Psychromonas sp.]